MKKIVSIICIICAVCGTFSCSDILETESTRQNIDPSLDEKTDSLQYTFGIMQAMQQLADQYVLQGEMRGELLATTQYADSMLVQLSNFDVTSQNRYDSAYQYYRVINNCNYYIAHRNTNLYTGAENVAIHEYAAVKAIRAWAYLQLARNYGRVPFFTTPLTEISQIDNNSFPSLDINGIVAALAPDLEKYTGFTVPSAGVSTRETKEPNWENTKKSFAPSKCYIPVDVILGDMYLEVGQYDKAASHFITYLTRVAPSLATSSLYIAPVIEKMNSDDNLDRSQLSAIITTSPAWGGIFERNSTYDIISYIPMSPNAQYGKTTNLPLIFGADYYATPDEQTGYSRRNCRNMAGTTRYWNWALPLVTNVQLVPSDDLKELSDSTEYYYYSIGGSTSGGGVDSIRAASIGDMRLRSVLAFYDDGDTELQWITKYDFANIILYRTSTVLLHLAEAFNRLGMYDVAFAILKDGISEALLRPSEQANSPLYMSEESKVLLQTTYPLLKDSFISRFPADHTMGIHCHGAGKATSDQATTNYLKGKSPYKLDRMVGLKLAKIADQFGVTTGTTKQDTINAIEDMLCDEYALEFAFEGNRYSDLLRLARHKNGGSGSQYDGSPEGYGASFGNAWLRKKLEKKGWTEAKMYLPFN